MSFLKITKGFTLVELIVVITVIGILTGGVAMSISNNAARARDTRRQTDLQQIKSALEFFRSNQTAGFYPTATSQLVSTYLEELPVDPSSTASNIINYSYVPTPAGCNNTSTYCTSYTLSADLEDGTIYTVTPSSVD